MNQFNTDVIYMQEALHLARKGEGFVSPNPMVGAVIVKDGKIIGKGYHQKFGDSHAEINAINSVTEDIERSTLYVTLEPCCHKNKKTPPCIHTLEKYPFERIVIGSLDPNPEVSGRGIEYLRNIGFTVDVGILYLDCEKLNRIFKKYIETKKPYVHLKLAQTLDGKMVTEDGVSKWITDEAARKEAHQLRMKYDGVVIGKETLIKDNPFLTIRHGVESQGKVPWRIIVGDPSGLETYYNLFNDEFTDRTILVYRERQFSVSEQSKITLLEERGVVFLPVAGEGNWLSTDELLRTLGSRGVASILVEGGPTLLTQFIKSEEYDKISVFIAPKILGHGRSFFEDSTLDMEKALKLENPTYKIINDQMLIESERAQ